MSRRFVSTQKSRYFSCVQNSACFLEATWNIGRDSRIISPYYSVSRLNNLQCMYKLIAFLRMSFKHNFDFSNEFILRDVYVYTNVKKWIIICPRKNTNVYKLHQYHNKMSRLTLSFNQCNLNMCPYITNQGQNESTTYMRITFEFEYREKVSE